MCDQKVDLSRIVFRARMAALFSVAAAIFSVVAVCYSWQSWHTRTSPLLVEPPRPLMLVYRWGFPSSDYDLHPGYVCSFDGSRGISRWVIECLSKADLEGPGNRDKSRFRPGRHPAEFNPMLDDYSGSGFDRGHLAPAGDMKKSQERMNASFSLSNIAPMRPGFNRGIWSVIEQRVRSIAISAKENARSWVLTGPAWLPDESGIVKYETIGKNHIAVPTHFWKAMLVDDLEGKRVYAWLVPHQNGLDSSDHEKYRLSIDELESAIGLDLFSGLPALEQKELESAGP